MATVRRARNVDVEAGRAWRLWTDVSRWPSFVEGFGHVERADGDWPKQGARVVWQSSPGGRGRVTEKVIESTPEELLVTEVYEEALSGRVAVSFGQVGELEETWLEVELEYELAAGGILRPITDALFIRRALGASLERTLARFATEAAEEAGL